MSLCLSWVPHMLPSWHPFSSDSQTSYSFPYLNLSQCLDLIGDWEKKIVAIEPDCLDFQTNWHIYPPPIVANKVKSLLLFSANQKAIPPCMLPYPSEHSASHLL